MRSPLCALSLVTLAVPIAAQEMRFVDTTEIDRLVEEFTGQPVGAVGGARAPVDKRLRLSNCDRPLAIDWHGKFGRTVSVSCEANGGWRIYVNINASKAAPQSGPVVTRGETVTVAVKGRGFTVQHQGEALEAGVTGEWIKVRMAPRSAPVSGKIVRPGLVVIPAA